MKHPSPAQVLSRVDSDLRALWSAPPVPGDLPKSRACTMNLVVVAALPALAEEWLPIASEVVQSIPARAIVVGLDPDGEDDLQASVSAVCTPGADATSAVCAELVSLVASGSLCGRLPSCVDAICAPEVPLTLVWLGRVLPNDPAFAPLAREANRIVLDGAHGSLASLAHVVRWVREQPGPNSAGVADLAWTRLAPWQELCARMFDEPRLRGLAAGVTRVSIVQASPPSATLEAEAALLLGWLATRLGWTAASFAGTLRLVRTDDVPVHIRLCGEDVPWAPRGALLSVGLEAGDAVVSMHGEIVRDESDGATWRMSVVCGAETRGIEQHVRLRANEPARLLERTLHRPTHDAALADAVAWADELRGEELVCGRQGAVVGTGHER